VNGKVVVAGADKLNELAKVNGVGSPEFDSARDKNANGIGTGRWLNVCSNPRGQRGQRNKFVRKELIKCQNSI
jgi:hypothetical protein